MLSKITLLLKQHISVVLFFGFLLFIIISVWYNGYSSARQAQDLVNFANESVTEVDQSLDRLITQSNSYTKSGSYSSEQLESLSALNSRLKVLNNKIPRRSTDPQSVNLKNSLTKFFKELSELTLEPIMADIRELEGQTPGYVILSTNLLKTQEYQNNIASIQNYAAELSARFVLS
ncbi:MAG: hypothetical protein AAGF07_01015 [Patescibacteria group bacterium]